ncbi:pepsin-like aspartic protease [Sporobolomyces salmoneus]|uniref:pepsin-like aspartic protease n=1 Tax=Sporobolomyces salmoneus TaxID=183962 RepID=UPI00316F4C29
MSKDPLTASPTPLFSGLIAFFSPLIAPSTRSIWCHHGGQIASLAAVTEINIFFGVYDRPDELVDRLRKIDVEIIDHSWISASLEQRCRIDLTGFSFSFIEDDRLYDEASIRDSSSAGTTDTSATASSSATAENVASNLQEESSSEVQKLVPAKRHFLPSSPLSYGRHSTSTDSTLSGRQTEHSHVHRITFAAASEKVLDESARVPNENATTCQTEFAPGDAFDNTPRRIDERESGLLSRVKSESDEETTSYPFIHSFTPSESPSVSKLKSYDKTCSTSSPLPPPKPAPNSIEDFWSKVSTLDSATIDSSAPLTISAEDFLAAVSDSNDVGARNDSKLRDGLCLMEHGQNGFVVKKRKRIWSGPVSVGTPPSVFNCYFDTGSADLALASPTCKDSCDGKARYDISRSSTAKATNFQVQSSWTTGSSGNGLLVRDTVTIGKTTVTSQDVVAETSIGSYVSTRATDGVVGFGFRDISAARSYAFPFTLFQQGGSPYFSMLLSRTPGKAKISFNGYNRGMVARGPTWFPVSKDNDQQFRTLWQIGRSTAYVNRRQAWKGFSNFALDSGSSLIIAPPDAAAEFWAAVPLSRKENDSSWSFPCKIPPRVAFVFGRQLTQKFELDPRDFNLGPLPSDPTRCLGAVIGQNLNLGDTWLIGDPFFRSFFLIFDVSQNRIGIATPR